MSHYDTDNDTDHNVLKGHSLDISITVSPPVQYSFAAMLEDRNDRSISIPSTPLPRSLSRSTPRALTVKPPPLKLRSKNQTEDDISVQPLSQANDTSVETEDPFFIPVAKPAKPSQCPKSHLENLPPEILEGIVSHIVGHLGSAASDSASQHPVRNWNAIMRHPRRKKLADLAIVSYTWRGLIQERIYRHIKIQGTKAALEECRDWFQKNTHLRSYVRHFEVLVPIWEMRTGRCQPRFTTEPPPDSHTPLFRAFQGLALQSDWAGEVSEPTTAFQPASKNATMDEIFGHAQALFPLLCAVTVEGGHCKRPPKVQYFREEERIGPTYNSFLKRFIIPFPEKGIGPKSISLSVPNIYPPTGRSQPWLPMHQDSNSFSPTACVPHRRAHLPVLPDTTTLVLKGAWNIIRSSTDFSTLASALPSLREFHCTYHKPKTGAYIAICDSLNADFPPTITNLNLCLEGLYTKSSSSLKKWRKLYPEYHICRSLGAIAPQLESLAYTGRVCGALFSTAIKAVDQAHGSCNRLKSIDIVVNNVCREPSTNNDGTGIHNWPFIQAFEALVLQAVRSLYTYPALKHIRIRFVDLDSPAPLLNPTFHLEGDKAWGFWSDEILRVLHEARPQVAFGRFPSSPHEDSWTVLQDDFLGTGKFRSTSVEYYKAMAQAGGFGI